jgi:mRNA interferase RelE/StbE
MKVKLHPKVQKAIDKINEPDYTRIDKALEKLEEDPPKGDIIRLSGKNDEYRLRIGDYRLMFYYENDDDGTPYIFVYKIGMRGQVYKGV